MNMLQTLNLKEPRLSGFVVGADYLKNIISLLSERTSDGKSLERPCSTIEVEKFIVDDDKLFSSFLDGLQSIKKRVKVFLHVDVRRVSSEIFMQELEKTVHTIKTRG